MSFIQVNSENGNYYRNLNMFEDFKVCYGELEIYFTQMIRKSKECDQHCCYTKSFVDRESMDKFIKENLENHPESENIKELQTEIKDLKTDIEEIKEMIKYMPGNKVYTEANEDFIAQQKN